MTNQANSQGLFPVTEKHRRIQQAVVDLKAADSKLIEDLKALKTQKEACKDYTKALEEIRCNLSNLRN